MKLERKKMASGERNVKTWYKRGWDINFFSLSSCTGLAPSSTCYRYAWYVSEEKRKIWA